MLMILRMRLKVCCRVLQFVQCYFLSRFRLGITDDTGLRLHASPFWIRGRRVVQLHQSLHDRSFRQPQPFVRIQTSRLSTWLRFSSDMLRCELAVAPDQFGQVSAPRTPFTETPWIGVCPAKVGPRHHVLHQHFSRRRATISAGLSIPT